MMAGEYPTAEAWYRTLPQEEREYVDRHRRSEESQAENLENCWKVWKFNENLRTPTWYEAIVIGWAWEQMHPYSGHDMLADALHTQAHRYGIDVSHGATG